MHYTTSEYLETTHLNEGTNVNIFVPLIETWEFPKS